MHAPKRPASVTGLRRFLPQLEKDVAKAARASGGRGARVALEISDVDDPATSSREQLKRMRSIARKHDAARRPAALHVEAKTKLPPYKFVGEFKRPTKELETLVIARGHAILRGSTFDTEGVVVNGKGPRALDGAARAQLRKLGARIITEAELEAELRAG